MKNYAERKEGRRHNREKPLASYAWYPLLREFRGKGVSNFHLANFLGCRAVKIPLLPIMAAYFGWTFTGLLSVLMIVSALLTGLTVARFSDKAA